MSCPDDVHTSPEKYGLTIVGEIDDPEACYSFDYIVVWQHTDGRLFYAQDSGCSCPSPFETFTTLESLTALTDETWDTFAQEVKDHCCPYDLDRTTNQPVHRYADDPQAADKTQLLAKVAGLLREAKS